MPVQITFPPGYCDNESLAPASTKSISDLSQYKAEFLRFGEVRTGTRALTQGGKELVAYSNFTPNSILQLLNANPNAKFVRVFNGVRADGTHYMFMTATDKNEMILDTIVVENCCQCPPRCQQINGGF